MVLNTSADQYSVLLDRLFTLKSANSDTPALLTGEDSSQEALSDLPTLKQALANVEADLSSSVVIVSPKDYLSLNVSLPLANPKSIAKVLPLELEDLLPFDTKDFVVHHRMAGTGHGDIKHVHVNVLPKDTVSKVLSECRAAGIEPLTICPPSSLLGALYKKIPLDERPEDCALVVLQERYLSILVIVKSEPYLDRVLDVGLITADDRTQLQINRECVSQILQTLSWASSHSGRAPTKMFVLGESLAPDILVQAVALPVVALRPSDFTAGESTEGFMAYLASQFILDEHAAVPFTDFRTQEFRYRFPWSKFFGILRTLLPYFLGAAAVAIAALAGTYYSRASYLTRLRNELITQVKAELPNLDTSTNDTLAQLSRDADTIDVALKDLGSPSGVTPLHAFAELSKHIPGVNITVRRIAIKGNKVTLEGGALNYSDIEKLDRNLRKRKRVYCDVKKGEGGSFYGGQSMTPFTFNLTLCD